MTSLFDNYDISSMTSSNVQHRQQQQVFTKYVVLLSDYFVNGSIFTAKPIEPFPLHKTQSQQL